MKLISIQVGRPREVEWQGKTVSTGIFKDPVGGPLWVRPHNIEGDGQADLAVHGGERKAVYAYGADAYPWWQKTLPNTRFPWGAFGENLTFAELDEKKIFAGDIYRLGDSELRVTEPRFPCFKLGIKFGDMKIIKTFLDSERSGVYFAVHKSGEIDTGQELIRIHKDPAEVSIWDFYTAYNEKTKDRRRLERILKVESLTPRWREKFTQLLTIAEGT